MRRGSVGGNKLMCYCAQRLADTELIVVVEVRDVVGAADAAGSHLRDAFKGYMQPRPALVLLRQAAASQFPLLSGSGR